MLRNAAVAPWVVLIASLLIALGFWRWAQAVLVPANTSTVLAIKRPIGNNSDLYPRWLGARELLLHRRDPYSVEVTRDIQAGFYGRPLDPQNPRDPTEEESFVYPLYVVFLLAPTVTLPFSVVAVIFRWLLLSAIAGSVALWMDAIKFRTTWPVIVSAMLLTLSSYGAIEEYYQQNLAAMMFLFLAAAAAAAVRKRLVIGGILLASATMKPDATGLLVLWFLLWASAKWNERRRLIYSFAVTMAALVAGAEALSPHWVGRFLTAVKRYPSYSENPTLLGPVLPLWLARLVAAALLVLLLVWYSKRLNAAAGSQDFAWSLAWTACVTVVLLPRLSGYNELLLVPALLVLCARYENIASCGFLPRLLTKTAFACLAWPWLVAGVLAIGSLWMPAEQLRAAVLLPRYTFVALPSVALIAIAVITFQSHGSAQLEQSIADT